MSWCARAKPADPAGLTCGPYRPLTNGKAERLIQTLVEEWASPQSKSAADDHLARWHPDNQSLLTVSPVTPSDTSLPDERELWRIPIDGTEKKSLGLRAPGLVYAALSPDMKRVAYASGLGNTELWLLSPAYSR